MAQETIDFDLPDAFHRLKRTVLVFSTALFIFHFAVDSDLSELALPAFGATVSLPTILVKWMLWGGGFYYLIGFLLEARRSIRLNSQLMKMAAGRTLEQHFENLAAEIEPRIEEIQKLGVSLPEAIDNLIAGLNIPPKASLPTDEEIHSAVQKGLEGHTAGIVAFTDSVQLTASRGQPMGPELKQLQDQFKASEKEAGRLAANGAMVTVRGHVGQANDQMRTLLADLRTLKSFESYLESALGVVRANLSDLRQLSRDIHGERRFGFYLWEIASAVTAFVVASAVYLPWADILRWTVLVYFSKLGL